MIGGVVCCYCCAEGICAFFLCCCMAVMNVLTKMMMMMMMTICAPGSARLDMIQQYNCRTLIYHVTTKRLASLSDQALPSCNHSRLLASMRKHES